MSVNICRAFTSLGLGCALSLAASAKAPNIVLILADDLDAAAAAEMPLVRQNITEVGTSFKQHFVSLSLCCPSRVTTLRGQFAHNTGVFTNGSADDTLPPTGGFQYVFANGLEASTVATWLSAAGYRTAMFGKYLNGYPQTAPAQYIPPGWSNWASPVSGDPYGEFDYTLNLNGVEVPHGHDDADYLTDVISRLAVDFIEAELDTPDTPFFLYVAPYAPHTPATPAPRHKHAFDGYKVPRGPAFDERDIDDKPHWLRNNYPDRLTETEIADMNELYRNRRESLLAVDEMVRDIVEALRVTGRLEDTYVFFASDNGYHQGQHRLLSGKDTAYEEDLLVPLVVRGPGVPHGEVLALTSNVDYASTFAAIAGIATDPDVDVDGRSLMPFLTGQEPPTWRKALLLEHKKGNPVQDRRVDKTLEPADPFDDGEQKNGIKPFNGLRLVQGRTTYVEYVANDDCEVYTAADPAQLENSCRKKVDQPILSGWLACLMALRGEPMRQAEMGPEFCPAPRETRPD
jgi:N-acetylglucosamine-6-sulfatase